MAETISMGKLSSAKIPRAPGAQSRQGSSSLSSGGFLTLCPINPRPNGAANWDTRNEWVGGWAGTDPGRENKEDKGCDSPFGAMPLLPQHIQKRSKRRFPFKKKQTCKCKEASMGRVCVGWSGLACCGRSRRWESAYGSLTHPGIQ